MATALIATREIEVDAEGFLQKPEQWTEEIGVEIARSAGIDPVTDRHWLVVRFMRERYLATRQAPTIRTLGKESGVTTKESQPLGARPAPRRIESVVMQLLALLAALICACCARKSESG